MGFFFNKFRENLGAQVFTAFTVLIFFICLSFILFFVSRQHSVLLSNWEENGKLLAKSLAHQSRIGVFSESEELLKSPNESLFQHQTVLETEVYNGEGCSIVRYVRSGRGMPISLPAEGSAVGEYPFKLMSGPGMSTVFHSNKEMTVLSPVMSGSTLTIENSPFLENSDSRSDDFPMGYVRIVLDKSPFILQYRSVVIKSILIGIGFLILGAVVTYVLAIRISHPLKQLAEEMDRFGKEGSHGELPVATRNEIGELAMSFRVMAENLERREEEKRQLENQLRQTQKMEAIGTLAGGIAHDFNNILGVINGYSELALLDIPEGTRSRKYLDEIFIAGQRARDLVQQILVFSRQGVNEPKPIQIGFTVKEVMKMLRAGLPSTIEVKSSIPEKLPDVIADPIQVYQVVMNLCANAGHAMRENGGLLEVTLEEVMVDDVLAVRIPDLSPGRFQKLKVRDTGHGMSPEVVERIFDPFFSTKEPGQGTGLGLSVVHGIVNKHGGGIDVVSKIGEGTTFEVYFPSLEALQENPVDEDIPLRTGSEVILLVDDEAAIVEMGRQMLESLGYKVDTQTSSVDALAIFEAQPERFDLVITDMTMPKMTGVELSKKMLETRPELPIVLCTGYTDKIDEDSAKAIGIREFVLKPVALRELAQALRRALSVPEN